MPVSKIPNDAFSRGGWWVSASLALLTVVSSGSAGANEVIERREAPSYLNPDLRLQALGARLAAANADQCARTGIYTGLMIHDEGGFDARDRAVMSQMYGFGRAFGVVQVVPGGTAEAAGIQRGDVITALNGESLENLGRELLRSRASYARTERFLSRLSEVLASGPAELAVERGKTRLSVTLSGRAGCGGQFVVLPDRSLNAWSDGRYVAVSDKMMRFASSDDELAFVVAHEMAHNILAHNKRIKGASLLLAEFGLGSGRVRKAELEADMLAVKLMARAGFDPSASERLLQRSAQTARLRLSLSHPGIGRRVTAVRQAASNLASTSQAQGSYQIAKSEAFTLHVSSRAVRSPIKIATDLTREISPLSFVKLEPAGKPVQLLSVAEQSDWQASGARGTPIPTLRSSSGTT